MRSIVTVASPASDTALTTLERVKLELGIPSGTTTSDPILQEKIEEASDDIEAALGFRLVRETAVETFWHEQYDVAPEKFVLDRTPVAAIASVVVDGVTIDASAYRLDPSTGELFALGNGYPSVWVFCRSVVVSSGSMPDTRAAVSSTFVTRARVLRNGAGRASSAAGLKRCSAPARGSVRGRAERAHAASVCCYS